MCAIAGIWSTDIFSREALADFTRSMVHPGPDGEGYRFEDEGCLGLGHRGPLPTCSSATGCELSR